MAVEQLNTLFLMVPAITCQLPVTTVSSCLMVNVSSIASNPDRPVDIL